MPLNPFPRLPASAALALALASGVAAAEPADPHAHHRQHAAPSPVDPHAAHDAHAAAMAGALGPYPMAREASGTSWQPEAVPTPGLHRAHGDWMLMLHGHADLVADRQGGPRGDDELFVASMLMAMGQRAFGPGTFSLRAMLSLDPLMGKDGYPLLFQTGETADGVAPLVDRQHPHDFFVELATTYSLPVGRAGSVFGYLGLPGEPALGPATFMHRAAGMALPEAPLTHHWLDSTHITFGVATLGATAGGWKLEASAFNGREPDHHRWNIETRRFDSASARLTFNPAPQWSLQASHGYLASPEQLEPDHAVHRTTASVSHGIALADGHWSTTLAVGINRAHGTDHPAWLLETTRASGRAAVFARAEWLENEHLVETGPLAGEPFEIGKLSVGGSHRLASLGAIGLRLGALASVYAIPDALEAEYGSNPVSAMLFLRAAVGD